MKTTAFHFLATLSLATSALAGHELGTSGKSSVPDKGVAPLIEPCFHEREFQLDVFGSYRDAVRRSQYSDGFGGGLAATYFFTRYFGIGIEGDVYNGGHDKVSSSKSRNLRNSDVWRASRDGAVWNLGGRFLARFPLEVGGVCIAPYAFAGGGVQVDGGASGTLLAGGGLEWRATPAFAVFGEGRYTWAADESNAGQVRTGVRFVF